MFVYFLTSPMRRAKVYYALRVRGWVVSDCALRLARGDVQHRTAPRRRQPSRAQARCRAWAPRHAARHRPGVACAVFLQAKRPSHTRGTRSHYGPRVAVLRANQGWKHALMCPCQERTRGQFVRTRAMPHAAAPAAPMARPSQLPTAWCALLPCCGVCVCCWRS
jgi:hypothetical protein